MAAPTPQHVGDAEVACPSCGESLAVPVLCEFVEGDRAGRLSLRCSPNLDPLYDHARAAHGLRLSRARRR